MKRTVTKSVATLQAEKNLVEQEKRAAEVKAADGNAATAATGKAELKAAIATLRCIDSDIATVQREDVELKAIEAKADEAIKAMVADGKISPQDAALTARFREAFIDNPDTIELHAGASLAKQKTAALTTSAPSGGSARALVAGKVAPIAGALTAVDGRINRFAIESGASYSFEFCNGWSAAEAIAGYAEIQACNERLHWNANDQSRLRQKSDRAVEAANWYKANLHPHTAKWEHIPGWALQKMCLQNGGLQASDYTSGTLGTLSGTLVLQRCLINFAFDYPELLSMYTDFSDTPGLFNQTETTRIVIQPTVQRYDGTLVNGLPNGWVAANDGTGTTVDVSLTLTDYIGVPIVVGNDVLASTTRRLFDEQAMLSVKGIAGYLAGMATNLITQTNFNAYAVTTNNYQYPDAAIGAQGTGGVVTNAYPTYTTASADFACTDLDKIHAAFTSMKVPKSDRGILLNPSFYAALRKDPRFYFLYMGAAKTIATPGDYLGEPLLPRISGFAPYEAAWLPTSTPSVVTAKLLNPVANTTPVAGFAYHKAGVILKTRLPQDFTQQLNCMVPGSITTITDPDTKISLMLVQYVDLTHNFAQWRPEVILGASVGDIRGGLVLTGT